MEKSSSERVLVVESDDALRSIIVGALSDAGYEVSTDYREGMKSVLSSVPMQLYWALIRPNWIVAIFYPKSKDPSALRVSVW